MKKYAAFLGLALLLLSGCIATSPVGTDREIVESASDQGKVNAYESVDNLKFTETAVLIPTIGYFSNSPEGRPPEFTKGTFRAPVSTQATPAVLIVHGTAGYGDGRGRALAMALLEEDIASLEIDLFGSRGLAPSAKNRISPTWNYLPDIWGALHWLSENPNVESSKIGMTGFSLGGALTLHMTLHAMRTETTANINWDDLMPKSFVAWYPVCSGFLVAKDEMDGYRKASGTELVAENLLIIAPTNDQYEKKSDSCVDLARNVYGKGPDIVWLVENATHGFDGVHNKSGTYYSQTAAQFGRSGRVSLRQDTQTGNRYRQRVSEYFSETLN